MAKIEDGEARAMKHDHHHNEQPGLPRKHEPHPPPTRRQLYYRKLHAKEMVAFVERPKHCPRCQSANIEMHDTRTWRGAGKWFIYYFPMSLGIFLYPIYLMWSWGSNNVFRAARETAELTYTKPHFVCHECGLFWLAEAQEADTK